MTPDPALLAALAAAPGIEPDPSQVGKVGVFLLTITPSRFDSYVNRKEQGIEALLVGILDPRDAEIARLRAKIVDLEAGR